MSQVSTKQVLNGMYYCHGRCSFATWCCHVGSLANLGDTSGMAPCGGSAPASASPAKSFSHLQEKVHVGGLEDEHRALLNDVL